MRQVAVELPFNFRIRRGILPASAIGTDHLGQNWSLGSNAQLAGDCVRTAAASTLKQWRIRNRPGPPYTVGRIVRNRYVGENRGK